ncbi:MAG: ZIP family metal transporter [Spirochaetia bacterium]|nr:ZIP family metal transporter [Spirochaetia bacterium]
MQVFVIFISTGASGSLGLLSQGKSLEYSGSERNNDSFSWDSLGRLMFVPAVAGFWLGTGFLLVLAVTLHNIPEGMAVGIVYAGLMAQTPGITSGGALALSLGIAIQNFPEGAIISLPLHAEGRKKRYAFLDGVLSGAVEPLGALLTIIATQMVLPAMPYLLSFAAGAMLYVVVEELIPEMSAEPHSDKGVFAFAVGFTLMMMLDVALG